MANKLDVAQQTHNMPDGRDKVIIDHQCDQQFPGCEIFSFLQEKFSGWPPLLNKRRFFA